MIVSEKPKIELIHGNCMDYMKDLKENAFDLVCIEKDEDYYKSAVKRFKSHIQQLQLFR